MKNKLFLFVLTGTVLSFVACNKPNGAAGGEGASVTGKIAYVDTDTLMEKYKMAVDLNEEFTKKQENMTADLNVKAKKVEDMIKSFQYRVKNGAFATRARAEKEQAHIEKKRQELVELNQTLTNELGEEYQRLMVRLQDSLNQALERFNKEAKYDLILRTTKGGAVLLGNPKLDITEAVVKELNSAYSQEAEAVEPKADTAKAAVK